MLTYVINLDDARDRWAHIVAAFGPEVVRVPAVDGSVLHPTPAEFSERGYRRFHGREINTREVACYLSHVRAIRTFLATGAPHALICEDDIVPVTNLGDILAGAMHHARWWDVLRLTGLSANHPLRLTGLPHGASLCTHLSRMKGAGAYVLNRKAAEAFSRHLLPMWLPYDHAFDREWFFGLRCASVLPFPISQDHGRFRSSIQRHGKPRHSRLIRWATTYPYQAGNEITRWAARFGCYAWARAHLGLASGFGS